MHKTDSQTEAKLGVRFHRRTRWHADTPPTWANKPQGEKWGRPGVIIWGQETKTAAHLKATQALQLLSCLQESDAWQEGGITVGESVARIWIDEPEREPEPALANTIQLTPHMTQRLLEALLQNRKDLEGLRDEEQRERARILGEVYRHILGAGWGKKISEGEG